MQPEKILKSRHNPGIKKITKDVSTIHDKSGLRKTKGRGHNSQDSSWSQPWQDHKAHREVTRRGKHGQLLVLCSSSAIKSHEVEAGKETLK